MTKPISTAQYYPWDGGAIFVGTAGVIPAHAHHAIQICFLFEGCIRLRSTDEDQWMDYELAIVPSQQRHAMDGSEVHYGATLFVEPETREGRALAERYACRRADFGTCSPSRPAWACVNTFCGDAWSAFGSTG